MKQNLYLQVLFCSFNKVVIALNELLLRLIWRWCRNCSGMVSCFVYCLMLISFAVYTTHSAEGSFFVTIAVQSLDQAYVQFKQILVGTTRVVKGILYYLLILRGFYVTYLFASRVNLNVLRSYWFSLSDRGNNSWCWSVRKNHNNNRVMKQDVFGSL